MSFFVSILSLVTMANYFANGEYHVRRAENLLAALPFGRGPYCSWNALHHIVHYYTPYNDERHVLRYILFSLVNRRRVVNQRNYECKSPLHLALLNDKMGEDQYEIVEMLIEAEADVHGDVDEEGLTPLHVVKRPEVARLLISREVCVDQRDSKGRTPVYAAVERDDVPIAHVLLEVGEARLDVPDNSGNTVLFAYKIRSTQMVQLLRRFAPIAGIKNDQGDTPMTKAVKELDCSDQESLRRRGLKFFRAFADDSDGIDWNEEIDADDNTLLHLAARRQCQYLVEFFISMNVNIEARNSKGDKAIHALLKGTHNFKWFASKREYSTRYEWIMDELLAAGADIDCTDANGDTSLHILSVIDNAELGVEHCVRKGADPNVKNNAGFTPLLSLLNSEWTKDNVKSKTRVFWQLVQNEADVSVKDNEGLKAVDYAVALREKLPRHNKFLGEIVKKLKKLERKEERRLN